MAEFGWSDLCDSEDDDEDYDPFKDPMQPEALEDSDSDSFDALRNLFSPKKPRGKSAKARLEGESMDASDEVSPVAQAHWHTRQQGKMSDDVWTRTDSLLEKAEMALDPMSPGAMSDTYQNEMLVNCTNPEYLRLLAVARGEREPEEDEDEEDGDFVPEDDDDGEGAGDNNDDEPGAKLSVSTAELSALIADNRSSKSSAGAPARAAQSAPTGNSPSRRARADAASAESGKGKEAAEEEAVKPVRIRRVRRDRKKKRDADSVVRVLPFSEVGGLMKFPGGTAGFSRDQCVQLQVCSTTGNRAPVSFPTRNERGAHFPLQQRPGA